MLDTNCLDFIFDQRLLQKMVIARAKGKTEFYLTTVQLDEIEAYKDKNPAKYEYVRDVIQKVPIDEAPIYGVYFGTDEPTNRGYRGPRIGHATLEEHDPLFDQSKSKLTKSHPLGDLGDVDIIRTAYYKNIDYIVTDNKKPFGTLVKRLQIDCGAKLKVISNANLSGFL
jgi:hypothetical protein